MTLGEKKTSVVNPHLKALQRNEAPSLTKVLYKDLCNV